MTTNTFNVTKLHRAIDANINRLKEGIRVIEDVARYMQDDQALSSKLKALRHLATIDNYTDVLQSRDSINDVLRPTIETELQRSNIRAILIANYKRAQESGRVLEELYKVIDAKHSETFKEIRYRLYTLEKEHLNSDI